MRKKRILALFIIISLLELWWFLGKANFSLSSPDKIYMLITGMVLMATLVLTGILISRCARGLKYRSRKILKEDTGK